MQTCFMRLNQQEYRRYQVGRDYKQFSKVIKIFSMEPIPKYNEKILVFLYSLLTEYSVLQFHGNFPTRNHSARPALYSIINSFLTLAGVSIRFHKLSAQSHKFPPNTSFQTLIANLGCCLCFRPSGDKSDISMPPPLVQMNLLEQLTELWKTVYIVDYQITKYIKG